MCVDLVVSSVALHVLHATFVPLHVCMDLVVSSVALHVRRHRSP